MAGADHASDSLHELLVVVPERVDGRLAETLIPHLLLEQLELTSRHGCWGEVVSSGSKVGGRKLVDRAYRELKHRDWMLGPI